MMAVIKDGWHRAEIVNITTNKKGYTEFHFRVGDVIVKGWPKEKIGEWLEKLAIEKSEQTNLENLIGMECYVRTETKTFNNRGFQVAWSLVVDVGKQGCQVNNIVKFDPNDWSMENVLGLATQESEQKGRVRW